MAAFTPTASPLRLRSHGGCSDFFGQNGLRSPGALLVSSTCGASLRRRATVHMSAPASKRLYNPDVNIVENQIEGTLYAAGGELARLEYSNSIKVVLRNDDDFDKDKQVALISGGGSGHEPSHAGWVGRGMLTAAVCGDIFASPSTEAVLAGIKAVAGKAGCLIIVKNYTGDRLNFGLAVEKAKSEGIKCDMVIVGDDVAIEDAPQPRGIAGAILVHKIAGAAAAQGMSLEEVTKKAQNAAKAVSSFGMALSVSTIPGGKTSDRLDGDQVEYGLGIHGEPGVEKGSLKSSSETTKELVQHLTAARKYGGPVALLVNNLGTLPPIELNIVVADTVHALKDAGIDVKKINVMTGMTSLDMTGFSITLCELTSELQELLDAPTSALAWLPFRNFASVKVNPLPEIAVASFEPPKDITAEGKRTQEVIRKVCQALIDAEPDLTAADQIVGDGDCGLTLKQGAERVLKDVDRYPVQSLNKTLNAVGISAGQSMGGTSGVLYHLGFTAAGAAAENSSDWHATIKAAADAISRYGGAKEGMRTMMDALIPAGNCSGSLKDAAKAAVDGAKKTGDMDKAGAGRSSYIPSDALKGTPDPGATAVGVWLTAVADAVGS